MTNNETSGFNLIELMIVIVILAITISVAVVKYADYSRRVEIASAYSSAKALEAAIIRKISIKDSPLSNTDKASFNLNSVAQKNIKYFASINVVDAAITSPSTSLPATVLAEITKSIPISNIVAHAKYDLTATCRLIADKPAQWFNIFYYLSSNDSTKQQISSTLIGVGAKLDCMPSTYQKILCPDTSYTNGGACVACTPLSGAIKPCSSTSDTTCVSGATQIGNNCKCNTGTYWDGTACSSCTPLTGPAGTVQACGDTSDATCIGGTTKTGNTCSCGTNQYWNGSACTNCTALTGSSGTVRPCSGSSDASCSAGTIKSGNACVCASGQYWNGSACTSCTSLTGPAGSVQACSASGDSSCLGGAVKSGSTCSCGTNQYWNGTACTICTPLTGPTGSVQACSTSGNSSCLGGTIRSGNTCSCGTNQNWNGSSCVTSCGSNQYLNGTSCVSCTPLTGSSGTVQACTATGDATCIGGTVRSGNVCSCNNGSNWDGNKCTKALLCPSGSIMNGNACVACPVSTSNFNVTVSSDGLSCVCNGLDTTRYWHSYDNMCSVCPPNQIWVGSCKSCPAGSDAVASQWVCNCNNKPCCPQDSFLYSNNGPCRMCPFGAICDGTASWKCKDGYVKKDNYSCILANVSKPATKCTLSYQPLDSITYDNTYFFYIDPSAINNNCPDSWSTTVHFAGSNDMKCLSWLVYRQTLNPWNLIDQPWHEWWNTPYISQNKQFTSNPQGFSCHYTRTYSSKLRNETGTAWARIDCSPVTLSLDPDSSCRN